MLNITVSTSSPTGDFSVIDPLYLSDSKYGRVSFTTVMITMVVSTHVLPSVKVSVKVT